MKCLHGLHFGLLILYICYAAKELTWVTNVSMGNKCYVMICQVL